MVQVAPDGAPRLLERVNVLGVGVSAINMHIALATIQRWIAARERHYVCITNVHAVMEAQRDEGLRAVLNSAGMVTPDGMPLVWLSRLHGARHVERVYGPDLLLTCCELSLQRGYTHFLVGGAEGVADLLANRLRARFPGLRIVGTASPPFRAMSAAEDDALVRRVNEVAPDIVWVGLGAPKQERWMHDHRSALQAPVIVGVGAAFDFHSGVKPQAPPWMQRSGLEWVFRLMTEPRRLWRRYLVNNPLFVWRVLLQALAVRQYRLSSDGGEG